MNTYKKGQALLETCVTLPLILVFMKGLILGIYFTLTYFVVDHWVYEGALCLASERTTSSCRKQLQGNLDKIPFIRWTLEGFSKSPGPVFVSLSVKIAHIWGFRSTATLPRPLRSSDFSGAY